MECLYLSLRNSPQLWEGSALSGRIGCAKFGFCLKPIYLVYTYSCYYPGNQYIKHCCHSKIQSQHPNQISNVMNHQKNIFLTIFVNFFRDFVKNKTEWKVFHKLCYSSLQSTPVKSLKWIRWKIKATVDEKGFQSTLQVSYSDRNVALRNFKILTTLNTGLWPQRSSPKWKWWSFAYWSQH